MKTLTIKYTYSQRFLFKLCQLMKDIEESSRFWYWLWLCWFKETTTFQFLTHPMATIDSLADNLFLKAETPLPDTRRYFVSSKRRLGLHGWGRYTSKSILVLDGGYNAEIEELMKHRLSDEGLFMVGTRSELMAFVKGLKNTMFDNAISMNKYREQRMVEYVETYCDTMANPLHVFRTWLGLQVDQNKIVGIDGYVFKEHTPFVAISDVYGDDQSNNVVIKSLLNSAGISAELKGQTLQVVPNCHPNEFIYRYYDSACTAYKLKLYIQFYSPEQLARHLMKIVMKHSFGIGELDFPLFNKMIRDHAIEGNMDHLWVTKTDVVVEGA